MDCGVRNSIKLILLNDADELLLMCIDDPTTRSVEGEYTGPFWTLIGGQVKVGETVLDAATRELFEETGMNREDVEFGPLVWFGEFDLVLNGALTYIRQRFIVARTKVRTFSLANLTQDETQVVKHLAWFTLDGILNSGEIIYPLQLSTYLKDIIAGMYPEEPLEINLTSEMQS